MEVTLSLLTIQEEVSFETAISAPIISSIEKRSGRPVLIKLVCAVLKLFADSLNVTNSFSPLQVYELAQLWIEQYPTESLKDLILCLKRVKMGKYGKIYNRIDIEVISEYWALYLNEKAEYRENQWMNLKTKEASGEKQMLQQIAAHAPETAQMVKSWIRPTPALALPGLSSHEAYVQELKERVPFASPKELDALRQQAMNAGKGLVDIVELIDEEIAIRKLEVTYESQ